MERVLDLGDVTVRWLVDLPSMRFAPEDMYGGPVDGAPADGLDLTFGGYLITTAGATVVVDTGIGDGKRRSRPAWNLRASNAFPESLRRAGIQPADVDVVYATHLHADHVGWHTVWDGAGWVPTFPRARYLVQAAELDWAREQGERDPDFNYGSYADSVAPLLAGGRLTPVDPDHQLADRVRVRATPGHTPGSSVVIVRGSRDTAVLSGDLLHHWLQLGQPALCSRFCQDRAASAAARMEILRWVADTGAILLPAHFAGGRLHAQGEVFEYRPV